MHAITKQMKLPVSEKNSKLMHLAIQPCSVVDERTTLAVVQSIYKAYFMSVKATLNA